MLQISSAQALVGCHWMHKAAAPVSYLKIREYRSSCMQHCEELRIKYVSKRRERVKGGRGRKASRKPKGRLRKPTQQHRPTQNCAQSNLTLAPVLPVHAAARNSYTVICVAHVRVRSHMAWPHVHCHLTRSEHANDLPRSWNRLSHNKRRNVSFWQLVPC
jgi:hypothetical protein